MLMETMSVEYEIKTRNLKLRTFLDIMYDIYGIEDYAIQTNTTWDLCPVEIYPSDKRKSGKDHDKRRALSFSDLLLDQYLHI